MFLTDLVTMFSVLQAPFQCIIIFNVFFFKISWKHMLWTVNFNMLETLYTLIKYKPTLASTFIKAAKPNVTKGHTMFRIF